ncbi:unnamed protein product [Effrenium voratum]|uniref:Uncharacterized protein n=1 Tax=Effrenium voratum TaxID=2562239 RepID=A0AA36HXQ0_9DINO|nr:unnamed protein product [Effrenium voratum]
MIPIGVGSFHGPPTEDMLAKLACVKWCVLATYLSAIGRLVTDEPFGAVNDVFGASFGAFLLKEDPALGYCFRCLQETPLGAMSEGGLSCLLPYLLMASLNSLFGMLRVYAIAVRYGTLLPCTGRPLCTQPLWVLLSALSQLLSSCICWKVYKLMQLQAMEYLRVDLNIGGAGGEGRSAQPLPLIRPFQVRSKHPSPHTSEGDGTQLFFLRQIWTMLTQHTWHDCHGTTKLVLRVKV